MYQANLLYFTVLLNYFDIVRDLKQAVILHLRDHSGMTSRELDPLSFTYPSHPQPWLHDVIY